MLYVAPGQAVNGPLSVNDPDASTQQRYLNSFESFDVRVQSVSDLSYRNPFGSVTIGSTSASYLEIELKKRFFLNYFLNFSFLQF